MNNGNETSNEKSIFEICRVAEEKASSLFDLYKSFYEKLKSHHERASMMMRIVKDMSHNTDLKMEIGEAKQKLAKDMDFYFSALEILSDRKSLVKFIESNSETVLNSDDYQAANATIARLQLVFDASPFYSGSIPYDLDSIDMLDADD